MSARAARLALVLSGSLALACSDRALDDDLEQLCRDHCGVGFECGYHDEADEHGTLDECIEDCVPSMKKRLENCAASVESSRCWSKLTCDEADEYAVAIMHFVMTGKFDASFPCRAEVVTAEQECYPK